MRKTSVGIYIAIGTVSLAILTLCSVAVVAWIGDIGDYNWTVLGNVGQSFGLAATIFSALVFTALVWSINLQVRESRAQRLETHRQTHIQLIGMALDDPDLMVAWPFDQGTLQSQRRHFYLNLWLWWWRYNYLANILSEQNLRNSLDELLRSQAARDYIKGARPFWGFPEDSKTKKFHDLVDEAYARAIADPPEPVSTALAKSMQANRAKQITWAAFALGCGLSLGIFARTRKSNGGDQRNK
jgi:uncharacterized membrane protein